MLFVVVVVVDIDVRPTPLVDVSALSPSSEPRRILRSSYCINQRNISNTSYEDLL